MIIILPVSVMVVFKEPKLGLRLIKYSLSLQGRRLWNKLTNIQIKSLGSEIIFNKTLKIIWLHWKINLAILARKCRCRKFNINPINRSFKSLWFYMITILMILPHSLIWAEIELMVLVLRVYYLIKIIFLFENSETNCFTNSAAGLKFYLEFFKGLFWVLFFVMSS